MRWLRKLAGQAPVPVFAVVGMGGHEALERLHLSRQIRVVTSPRQARTLAVLGRIDPEHMGALNRVHDQVPSPRASVWFGGTPAPGVLGRPAVAVDSEEDLDDELVALGQRLLTGQQPADPDLCPDEPPEPWKGLGDGHGGEGMMGGKPYGRPMAMPEDDLRDGLQLDPLSFTLGPFSPLLPPGMTARVTLHGDVISEFQVQGQPYPASLPAVFHQALEAPVAIADIELARARYLGGRLANALEVSGLTAAASGLRRQVSTLGAGDRLGSASLAPLWRKLPGAAGSGCGRLPEPASLRLRGPSARAAGYAADARQQDPAYQALGFEPVIQHQGTTGARWRQWFDEANQALALAAAATEAAARTTLPHPVETPVGPLFATEPLADCTDLLAPLLTGLEWSEAVATLASLDLAAVHAGGGES